MRPRRQRTTRPSVKLFDRVARNVIRIGGVGTIAAISTVFFFLLWVVWPLLRQEHIDGPRDVAAGLGRQAVLAMGIDDTQSTIWGWTDDGRFVSMAAADGSLLSELTPFPAPPTSWAFPVRSSQAVFGFADGSLKFVVVDARTEYRDIDAMPPEFRDRPAGDRFLLDGRVAERISVDQFALRSIAFEVGDPVEVSGETKAAAIVAVDLSATSNGPATASVDANGVLRVTQVSSTRNFLTGKTSISAQSGELPLHAVGEKGLPRWVMLRGLGDNALVVWEDGHALRVDAGDLANLEVVEELDLLSGNLSGEAARVSSLRFANGKNTLLIGDTLGGLQAWFRVPAPTMATGDGAHFTRAHELERGPAAVTALVSSPRTRLVVVGYADGTVRVVHVTTDRVVAESPGHPGEAVTALALVPDDSGVVSWDGRLSSYQLSAPHPEISATALLRPIHYEGYSKPEHVWQSSSGTDDFEPKLGLWPLVFGTLKATLYSMMFAVPIALLAALHTSEFLHRDVKAKVKPAVEMLASLPSVVLGFLAALVLAPLVEKAVPEILAGMYLIPFFLLLAAHGWQFVPEGRRSALQGTRVLLAGAAIVAAMLAGTALGGPLERLLFAGDLRLWLDGESGDATGGWVVFCLPFSALLASWVVGRVAARLFPGRGSLPLRSLLGFLAGTLAAIGLAVVAGAGLSAAGFELRGGVVGTYVQRNALVVGFMMGFAIIPIIYTIAEDALSSIPENLRAASLALGATPWQTAVRVVVPTAMSGLFSAVMVGLGRAVGETMIVLMAAGNTPVLDWSIFNGFRTLSANIAVELPEAVRNGTHYRTLFLAAFTLFLVTFVLNTAAEIVRLRFRSRAQQL